MLAWRVVFRQRMGKTYEYQPDGIGRSPGNSWTSALCFWPQLDSNSICAYNVRGIWASLNEIKVIHSAFTGTFWSGSKSRQSRGRQAKVPCVPLDTIVRFAKTRQRGRNGKTRGEQRLKSEALVFRASARCAPPAGNPGPALHQHASATLSRVRRTSDLPTSRYTGRRALCF